VSHFYPGRCDQPLARPVPEMARSWHATGTTTLRNFLNLDGGGAEHASELRELAQSKRRESNRHYQLGRLRLVLACTHAGHHHDGGSISDRECPSAGLREVSLGESGAVRDSSAALLLDLLLAGAVAHTCPVLSCSSDRGHRVRVRSARAERLRVDPANSVEIIGSEEHEPGRLCVYVDRAPLPSSCPGVVDGLGAQ